MSGDVASAGLYVSNLRFGLQANDYFAAAADPSPVLHFWSLSVEEQFYIVWPTIVAGLFLGLTRASSTRRLAVGIGAIGLASLVGAVWLTDVNQPWAFYLLPTRAWELAVGGLIAVGVGRLRTLPVSIGAVATVAGLACIGLAAATLTDDTSYPGTAAILPVAGAALVIIGGAGDGAPVPSRALAIRPMRYLGRISYSLYLWHWPILLFGGILLGPSFAIPLALLAIPVAAASQRWIEEPLRYGRFIGTRPRRNLLQAGVVGLVVVVASAVVLTVPAVPGPVVAGAGGPGDVASDASNLPVNLGTPAAPGADPSGEPIPPAPRPCGDCTIADLSPPLADLRTGRIEDANCDVTDRTKCFLGSTDSGRAAHRAVRRLARRQLDRNACRAVEGPGLAIPAPHARCVSVDPQHRLVADVQAGLHGVHGLAQSGDGSPGGREAPGHHRHELRPPRPRRRCRPSREVQRSADRRVAGPLDSRV